MKSITYFCLYIACGITSHHNMGYDAVVFVIYGVEIKPQAYETFIQYYLENHPAVRDNGKDEGYEMDSHELASEYIENFVDDIDGNRLFFNDDGIFICSFCHEHSVLRTKDPVKKLILPTESEKLPFDTFCQEYSLPQPELLTLVVD